METPIPPKPWASSEDIGTGVGVMAAIAALVPNPELLWRLLFFVAAIGLILWLRWSHNRQEARDEWQDEDNRNAQEERDRIARERHELELESAEERHRAAQTVSREDSEKREAESERRHKAELISMAEGFAKQSQEIAEMKAIMVAAKQSVEERGDVLRSLRGPIQDVSELVANIYAQRQRNQVAAILAGRGTVTSREVADSDSAKLAKSAKVLKEIAENPPTTEQGAKALAEEIHRLILKPVGSQVGTESGTPTILNQDPVTGELLDNQGKPVIKPSKPDTGEQIRKEDDA